MKRGVSLKQPRNLKTVSPTPRPKPTFKCAIGLQVGTRKFLDTGIEAWGVFGLTGWEEPCEEPVVARCQLSYMGKAMPYFWYACANPMHQRDAFQIEHLDSDGNVTKVTKGVAYIEAPIAKESPALPPKKRKKTRKL